MIYVLWAICVLAIFFVMVIIIDGTRFVTKEYTIYSPKVTKEYKICLLADLHNRRYGTDNYKLIAAIRNMNPDFICAAGDMLTARPGKDDKIAVDFFSYLREYPVYYSIGNHEYRMKIYPEVYGTAYDEYVTKLKELGVNVLENDHIDICDANIRMQGIMIDREYYKRFENHEMTGEYITELTKRGEELDDRFDRHVNKNMYILPLRDPCTIMLAHNPEYFVSYADAGADVVLSGHVHGGIMRLPFVGGVISPKLKMFPRFDGGIFTCKRTQMVLSRGLGSHTIPIRIFNPGELVSIVLAPCKKG